MTKEHREISAKGMSKRMTKHGLYALIQEKTIPKCDICPISNECEFKQLNSKCAIMRTIIREFPKQLAKISGAKPQDAPMLSLFADEFAVKFWVTLWLTNEKPSKLSQVFYSVRSKSVVTIKSILSKFGCSPADRRLFGIDDEKTDGYYEVLKDEKNRTPKSKK